MAEVRIGTCSWTADAWWGRVYRPGTPDSDRLGVYARLYDTVEVDATYYRPPAPSVVDGWRRKTPEGFRFALKCPRELLDPRRGPDRAGLAEFVRLAGRLGPKLGPILLQFSPGFRPGRSERFLDDLLEALAPEVAWSIELRDAGWYRGEAGAALARRLGDRAIALTWSYLSYLDVPPWRTADFVYLRFIGDHDTIPPERLGEVRVDRRAETERWAARLRAADDLVRPSYVFFNNHYAGFAPDSANDFRVALGLAPVDFGRYVRGARRLDDGRFPEAGAP
jgi:uncharacterized protein YecE (DUF72 family)